MTVIHVTYLLELLNVKGLDTGLLPQLFNLLLCSLPLFTDGLHQVQYEPMKTLLLLHDFVKFLVGRVCLDACLQRHLCRYDYLGSPRLQIFAEALVAQHFFTQLLGQTFCVVPQARPPSCFVPTVVGFARFFLPPPPEL